MTIIDVHNHYYPPAYLDALRAGSSVVKVDFDAEGNPRLHYPGDYNVAVRGHRDIDFREGELAKYGVDMQVISLTTPGTHVESPANAVKLAALATLPLNDPTSSVKEFERACRELQFRGAMLFSNINGVALSDERFWPLYERANDLDAILYIHPTAPVGVEAMTDYWLMPLVGFLFDTTLAAEKLVFSGVAERFPRIRWVLSHLGGAIPYIAERADRGFRAFKECRVNISRPPSEYLKLFYYDTVNFDPLALKLAVDFAGVEHILAGSDYPHQIGSIPEMLKSLRGLPIPAADKDKILGGNAAKLLRS